jgi:hypothetical protein
MNRIYAEKYIEIGESLNAIRVHLNFTDDAKSGEEG